MATIHEMLDQVVSYSRQTIALALALKGEAPADESAPPAPPAPPSKFINGKSAPDHLGRVELELVDKLAAEFGEAPNGYRIPRLWFVPDTDLTGLTAEARGDHGMTVNGAAENKNLAYSYKPGTGWFGKPARVQDAVIPSCLAWEESLADLEAALRYRIQVLKASPAYVRNPDLPEALHSVAGYLDLKKPIA